MTDIVLFVAVEVALCLVLGVVAVLSWFASLISAREPLGLQRLGAFALRYHAQTAAFAYLLTDRYPYSGPIPFGPPQAPPPAQPSPTTGNAVVSGTDLTRRYGEGDTAVDALRGVSLDVPRRRAHRRDGPVGLRASRR